MSDINIARVAKRVLSAELASRNTDPRFYSGLNILPDPDPILRELGYADQTYNAIKSDAHVMGELRSIRAGLLGYKFRAVATDEDARAKAAQALCQQWLNGKPSKKMPWRDVIWNMGMGVFYGRQVHEAVWEHKGGFLLPQLKDRPNRRFVFDLDNNLRLLTKDNQTEGELTPDYKFLLTRHMASAENPYGQAVFSSCFWPYTFKHGGFKIFYQFCERFGLPWPIGKYPPGTQVKDQQELLDALINMLQQHAGVIPDGDSVELIESKTSGELVQESLIHLCNREMSKAITSQTMATELRNVGSNAASQTASQRQNGVAESDRFCIQETMTEAFQWITQFNFGEDVSAPKFEFYKPPQLATKERLEAWRLVAEIGNGSTKALHEEFNIQEAESDEDKLKKTADTPPVLPPEFSAKTCSKCQGHEFAKPSDNELENAAINSVDSAIENSWIAPAFALLKQTQEEGKGLKEFQAALPGLYGQLDDDLVLDITDQVMVLASAQGMDAASS